jgi:hypothetical protein
MPAFAIKCLFTYVKDGEIRVQAEFLLYHFFQLFTVPVQDASTKRPQPVFILSIKSSLNDFIPDK